MSYRKSLLFIAIALLFVSLSSWASEPYHERWRPQFHFSPAKNWMNDPNGMVFFEGEYHLFYQYNPFGDKWGHMSWGHTVSKDLVHWEHLPVALFEENDVMIFSGSAVIDWKNMSGFGKGGVPPMIAIYTGHYTKKPLQNQHIAYSNDRGRTWTKFEGNPVLDIGDKDFRDPKVMWHEPTQRWIMTVAWPIHRKVRFYSSPDLKTWTHLSDFGPAGSTAGIWECPDLFPLSIEGKRNEERWVLIVSVGSGGPANGNSAAQYFIGQFDGRTFSLDPLFPQSKPDVVPDGVLLADFEGNNYGDWKSSGEAFGTGPSRGALPNQQPVEGFRGRGLINSYRNGDGSQGALTSPTFNLSRNFVSFLIGGGAHSNQTCMNLIVEGKVVRTAMGAEAERLSWSSWDVRELKGKDATIEIVDRHTGGWGHINVDHIMLTDTPAVPADAPKALWADYGPDFYAPVSWSDIPKRDGRRLWLGWMSNWQYAGDVPTAPWRSAMSIARELTLRETSAGLRMVQKPVREMSTLRGRKQSISNVTLEEANEWLRKNNVAGPLWEIDMEVGLGPTHPFAFEVMRGADRATLVRVDNDQRIIRLDRRKSGTVNFHPKFSYRYEAPYTFNGETVKMRVFVDTSSVEVFVNDGEAVLTSLVLPPSETLPMHFSEGHESLLVRSLNVWKLKSAVPIREGR